MRDGPCDVGSQTDGHRDGDALEREERQGWGRGCEGFPHRLLPPAATMGGCCSSDYDEDWIENIDICEHCNYPIEPDSKRQVRRGRVDPPSRWLNASGGGRGMAKPREGEGSRGSSSPRRG